MRAYYPDVGWVDVPANATLQEVELPKTPEKLGLMRRLGDVGVDVAQGAIGVPEALAGLAGLVPGVHYAADPVAGALRRGREALGEALHSEQALEREKGLREAFARGEGVVGSAKEVGSYLAENPWQIISTLAETAPGMIGGGLLARGGAALAGRTLGAGAAGYIGEGAMAAGQAASEIAAQTPGEYGNRLMAVPIGAATMGIAKGTGAAFGRMFPGTEGIDLDVALANLGRKGVVDGVSREGLEAAAARSLPSQMGVGALREGIFEEPLQSASETALQNIALGRPWDQDVGGAVVMGAAAGGLMGAGMGPIGGIGARRNLREVRDAEANERARVEEEAAQREQDVAAEVASRTEPSGQVDLFGGGGTVEDLSLVGPGRDEYEQAQAERAFARKQMGLDFAERPTLYASPEGTLFSQLPITDRPDGRPPFELTPAPQGGMLPGEQIELPPETPFVDRSTGNLFTPTGRASRAARAGWPQEAVPISKSEPVLEEIPLGGDITQADIVAEAQATAARARMEAVSKLAATNTQALAQTPLGAITNLSQPITAAVTQSLVPPVDFAQPVTPEVPNVIPTQDAQDDARLPEVTQVAERLEATQGGQDAGYAPRPQNAFDASGFPRATGAQVSPVSDLTAQIRQTPVAPLTPPVKSPIVEPQPAKEKAMRGNEKGTRDALQEETPQAAPAVGTQAATSTPIPVTIAKRLAGKKDAVLVRGSNVSGAEYVLYEPGTRTHYTKDWKALQQEASGDDAVRTAMRYRQPEDVVSLNPSAQAKLDNEAAAIEAQKQADAVAAADRLKSVELRESLRASLEGVKFKGGQFVGAEQTEPVKANFAGPLAVHKSYGHFRKGQQEFTVSHVGTQLAVLKGFKSLAAAKQAAVRLDRAGPFAELKGPESLREPEFERIKKVALAIKSSGMDPLASPEIDAPQRGVPNAIQEPSPAQVDVRDRAEDGGAVEQRDAQAQEASKEGEAPPKEYVGVALPPSEQAKAILRDPKTSEQLDSVTVTHRVWDAKAGKWVPQEMSALKAAKSIISDIDKLTAYRQCLEGG